MIPDHPFSPFIHAGLSYTFRLVFASVACFRTRRFLPWQSATPSGRVFVRLLLFAGAIRSLGFRAYPSLSDASHMLKHL
jgi:hypothetical protein